MSKTAKKNRTRLTASDRLILAEFRALGHTATAGDILGATRVSIHTLVDSLTRLKRMAFIEQVETGCGPGYDLIALKPTVSTEVAS